MLRVAFADAPAGDLARSSVSWPLTLDGTAGVRAQPGESPCWLFELDPGARFPDGSSVGPQDLIAAWERELARDSSSAWLLDPLRVDSRLAVGPRTDERTLELCPSRPAPDLPERLRLPGLWLWRFAPATGLHEGPGPFRELEQDVLTPNPHFAGEGPYLDRVEPVPAIDLSPTLLLQLDQADLSVLYGRDAGELLASPTERVQLERLPGWDRAYALWLNPERRWVNDPAFRRWVSSIIDRREMLDYLFDGRGEPASALVRREPVATRPEPRPRPLAHGSEPRMPLVFDGGDRVAASIAARTKAVLGQHRVEVVLEPLSPGRLHERIAAGDAAMVLLAHHPATEDPILALLHVLSRLGGAVGDLWRFLDQASTMETPAERRRAAEFVETSLLDDGRLVPLVRLHAWLATDRRLVGVRAGPHGVLYLQDARWAR